MVCARLLSRRSVFARVAPAIIVLVFVGLADQTGLAASEIHREPWSIGVAMAEFIAFDPRVVGAFVSLGASENLATDAVPAP